MPRTDVACGLAPTYSCYLAVDCGDLANLLAELRDLDGIYSAALYVEPDCANVMLAILPGYRASTLRARRAWARSMLRGAERPLSRYLEQPIKLWEARVVD